MEKKKSTVKFPIMLKAALLIIGFALTLVVAAMFYFATTVAKNNEQNYKNIATDVSSTVSEVIDSDLFKTLKDEVKAIVDASETKPLSDEWGSDEWNEYIAQFDGIAQSNEFITMRDFLRRITSAYSDDISCVYLSYVDPVNRLFVYVVDAAPDEDACPPGCLDPLFDFNERVIEDPSIGFPAYITNTEEYGALVTAGSPVYAGDEVVGYAVIDISMTVIRENQKQNIVNFFIFLSSTVTIIVAVGLVITYFVFSYPIKKLTEAANSYNGNSMERAHEAFTSLDVRTHDEVHELAETMKQMELDVYSKIKELVTTNEDLVAAQQEREEMRELANTDGLTGVYNKVAYSQLAQDMDELIADGEIEPFGLAMIDLNWLKNTNDKYGHDSGDKVLIKLSEVMTTVFKNSLVYRVGGDEFIVVLCKEDYKNSHKLIKAFNKEIDLLSDKDIPVSERVSAAIGYAIFDPKEDRCVDDVFKRADKAMYKRKNTMKKQ